MFKKVLLLAAGLLVLAACAPKSPDTTADETALRADPDAWMEAYNAGNADGVANLYIENATLLAPGAPAVTGRTAIREYFAADIQKSKAAGITFKNDGITGVGVAGDLGWISGKYSVTDTSGANIDKGKYLSVYQRENGQLHLIRDTWNSDMAPAPAAPPAQAAPAAAAPATPTGK